MSRWSCANANTQNKDTEPVLGVLRLAKTFGRGRLEAACGRALEINARSYSSLHSILKNGLDRKPRTRATDEPAITHPNIRGAEYFH